MSEVNPDSPGSPPTSAREENVDANSLLTAEMELDPDMMSVDFSSDFSGRTDVIKAMAARWSKTIVTRAGQRIEKVIKVKDIKDRMKGEPFLRAKDKFSFLLGVMMILFTEYVLISYPSYLYIVYSIILVPLLTWRFISYHQHKHHYFMLDFCYFDNLLVVIWLYIYPNNAKVFKLVFALSTGPLLMAVIAWSNSLVFHDIDRVTSLFIHIYPPLVLYAERWHNPKLAALIDADEGTILASLFETVAVPMIFYATWQLAYLIKTEVIDRKRMDTDADIVTSARWLTRNRPHAMYLWLRKRGVTLHENLILVIFQLCYTLVTLAPGILFFSFRHANQGLLISVLAFATWNGANFYFEIFSERYRQRLLKKEMPEGAEGKPAHEAPQTWGPLPSSSWSVFSFSSWLAGFMAVIALLIQQLCQVAA